MSMIIIIILIFPLPPPNSFLPFRMFFLAMILQNKKQESHCPYFSPSPRGWGWLIIFLWLFFWGGWAGQEGYSINTRSCFSITTNIYCLFFFYLLRFVRDWEWEMQLITNAFSVMNTDTIRFLFGLLLFPPVFPLLLFSKQNHLSLCVCVSEWVCVLDYANDSTTVFYRFVCVVDRQIVADWVWMCALLQYVASSVHFLACMTCLAHVQLNCFGIFPPREQRTFAQNWNWRPIFHSWKIFKI